MQNKAYSLNIGLNSVNPKKYRDWDGKLKSCEADAYAMEAIAKSLNYNTQLLLTAEATKDAFFNSVASIRSQIKPGDLFLLSFSGHGGQVLDTNGDEKEEGDPYDTYDETWCFYDGQVLDDKIHELLQSFEKGVRILVISDSCFSGTMLKDPEDVILMWGRNIRIDLPGVEASVLLISSSQELEVSRAKRGNGLFTSVLLKVWDKGNFTGNYADFYKAIVNNIPFQVKQTPNYLIGGTLDEEFYDRKPFVM